MTFGDIRALHIGCVAASVSLFTLRGALHLRGADFRRSRLLRIAPHVVDTVLLGSTVALAFQLHQAPFVDAWLTAKLLALVAYVGLGTRALSPRTPPAQRPAWFVAALATVAYIAGVAVTHSPTWGL